MQTRLIEKYKQTTFGQEADRILRNCVHCGFCTATCPTYQLIGDELDGPRGRIYLIKQVLEGNQAGLHTLTHLDRCLTCRSCETTCPSGVEYAKLIDIGRHLVESQVRRPIGDRIKRGLLHWILTDPRRFARLYRLAARFNRYLPAALKVHTDTHTSQIPQFGKHAQYVILLQGCVQPAMAPNINLATQKVLDRLGISMVTVEAASCCGAISQHMNRHEQALAVMRRNIDAWWPYVSNGCKAIVSNASGCGVMLKDYAHLLASDPVYANKASIISDKVRDISELIPQREIDKLKLKKKKRVAFHPPCTLQHGLKLKPSLERLLRELGFELVNVNDSHLCCGSAGTYSLLQPSLAMQLRDNKLQNLNLNQPESIVTANIGCQHHLQSGTNVPVQHWIEVIADNLS